MANQKHLALVKEGAEVWNQWRDKNPEIEPDLWGADLQDADLQGFNLKNANLKEAMLFGVNFQGANLQNADLQQANLYEANLTGTDLRRANLLKADGLNRYIFVDVLYDETTKIPDYVNFGDTGEPEFKKTWIAIAVIVLAVIASFIFLK